MNSMKPLQMMADCFRWLRRRITGGSADPMTPTPSVFTTSIRVEPPTALSLQSRPLWEFTLTSVADATVEAKSTHPDAETLLRDGRILSELEQLSWDLLWEKLVVVEFEPSQYGKRIRIDELGRQLIDASVGDTVLFNPPNPRAGLRDNAAINLLQRIRDRVITAHLAGGDAAKAVKLMGDAAVLLAVEHFVKGLVNGAYSLVEFYLVVETIKNQIGGRNAIQAVHGKTEISKITKYANDGQLDQRHAPKNPSAIAPLPPNIVNEAAVVAKAIIVDYAKKVI